MGDEPKVGLAERFKGYFRNKAIRPSDKVDRYITGRLPELIGEYKLATRNDLGGIDRRIEEALNEVSELDRWREETKNKIEKAEKKVSRLEKFYGIGEDKNV